MASITKTRTGYRAQVYVRGVRDSATHRTRREAEAWAAARETELRAQALSPRPPAETVTLREVMQRYAEEVSPGKRGERWEVLRLDMMARHPALCVDEPLARLTPARLGQWRDARLRVVQPGTVLRESNLLGAVLEHARREWRLIEANPMRDVRRPSAPHHREVVIAPWQVRRMLRALGYSRTRPPVSVRHAVAGAFLLALRTGMRAGEVCGLRWDRVQADHVELPVTKTRPRQVSLSRQALRVLDWLRGWDDELVVGIPVSSLDANFRKYRARAGLDGFTFHDTRHTAATMLARRLDVLDLCKMFGWSDPRRAMIYYNPTASEIARRLNQPK